MCGGPESLRKKMIPPGFAMEEAKLQKPNNNTQSLSILLELAALNDLVAFKKVAAEEGCDVQAPAPWYSRRIGSGKMGWDLRTPLMIASLYGSSDVMKYILSLGGTEVNRACGSDGATALHCAAAGGSPNAAEIVLLLLAASADLNALDANGNRPGDLIARPVGGTKSKKSLESMIKERKSSNIKPNSEENSDGAANSTKSGDSPRSESEKKEYFIDTTLPDIKSGIFSSDDFRMYVFKVRPCSRMYSHDWTECPFAHPGENARRRDPRKYQYSCVPCPEFRKGICRQGDACDYAHGVFECWLHPAQYRTRLCKEEANCNRRVCFFAHKLEELRPPSVSSMDMASVSPLSMGGSSMMMLPTSTPPMSPSFASAIDSPTWPSQSLAPPALQLSGSRLKSSLGAKDLDLGMDLVGLESLHQHQLIDEIANLSMQANSSNSFARSLAASTGSRSGKFNHMSSLATPNLGEMFGSFDASTLSQQGLGNSSSTQFQSSSFKNNGYAGNGSSSLVRSPSPLGLDSSLAAAAALMNSRAAAFAKRSQSFCDRSGVNHYNNIVLTPKPITTMSTTSTTNSMLSDWSSPNEKLDWGIQGDELHKLKKSATFAIRSTGNNEGLGFTDSSEPDLSWVQSLPSVSQGWNGMNPLNSLETLAPWGEQSYGEQD